MSNRTFALAVAILLLLISMAALIIKLNAPDAPSGIILGDVEPQILQAGQFNTLTVTLNEPGPARLLFNSSLFVPQAQGNYSQQYLDFSGGRVEFEALLSPYADQARFFVKQSSHVGEAVLEVALGDSPLVTGQAVYDWETLLTDSNRCATSPNQCYNGRWLGGGSPTLENFVRDAQGWLLEAGMDEVYEYRAPADNDVVNLIAKRYGVNGPDTKEWVVIGGHMDLAPPAGAGIIYGTWEGAYDNTAGVSHLLALAEAVGRWQPQKTVVLAFWSNEEEGAWGSEAWVNDPEEVPADIDLQLYLNLDMMGLNWPGTNAGGRLDGYPADAPYLFRGFVGPDENESVIEHPAALQLMQYTAFDFLRIPDNITEIELVEAPRARSDHANFWDIGTTTFKYFGIVDEYDEYHKVGDTLDHMEELMGGADTLIASFDYWMWLVYMNLRFNDISDDIHREGFGGS